MQVLVLQGRSLLLRLLHLLGRPIHPPRPCTSFALARVSFSIKFSRNICLSSGEIVFFESCGGGFSDLGDLRIEPFPCFGFCLTSLQLGSKNRPG